MGTLFITVPQNAFCREGAPATAERPYLEASKEASTFMGKANEKSNKVGLTDMALTRSFKQTVVERVERDPEFAKALLDEAAFPRGAWEKKYRR